MAWAFNYGMLRWERSELLADGRVEWEYVTMSDVYLGRKSAPRSERSK